MLGSSESRVPKILSQIALKPNKMNSTFYLNKAKDCFKNNNYPDAYENFVNYFDSLDDPTTSTPAVQLGFTKLVCRIGLVLEEANDTEELLKVYLQALNLFPNNYIILNNLGGYLFKMGEIDIARRYLDMAVSYSKNYLPAEKNLMHCKWHQIPRWHFKMLNDKARNIAYSKAITNIIRQGFTNIVDIGTGCGLLSLIASQNPEVNVTAIEENKLLAKMCENIMKENERNNVKILNCNSTKLVDPPTPCNFLMTEIFDVAIFGERMLESLVHAHQVLITEKDRYKIVPCAAKLYASAINYRSPQAFRVVNQLQELNLKDMCIRQIDADPYDAEDLSTKDIDYMSEPVIVFDLDFYDFLELNDILNNEEYSKIIEIECYKGGSLTSLAVWFDLILDEETTITTDPRNDNRVNCWEQAVFHLVHPIDVVAGETIQFEVTVLENQLKFYQITKPNTCVACWLVSKEIVTFLNDAPLVNEILALTNKLKHPDFINQFPDPNKPIMDLMSFPLLGFILAATQGCQFYTTIKSESDFQYVDFFDHILRVNNIPQGKMIVVENKLGQNTTMCGIHKYLKECRACLLDPISTDGSIHPTIGLKEKIIPDQPDIFMLPAKIVVKVVLIYSEKLETWNFVQDKNVFDFKISRFINEYSGCEHPNLENFVYEELSSPISFIVDDKDYVKKTQNVLITESGKVNGLYTWYELKYHGNIDFSTKESFYLKKTCYLMKHKRVELGDLFRVVMRREGTYLDFRLDDEMA
ncbi:protein arginine N-methyltransferase 9-like isoform X1 [Rhynchophorus ferrugineus]|uniref:protein arginine N-methyltransferase 9-like isoform X1 n=1 Tax=Rhynchophorus ferrugineus TaxID=354439 RepID=UPI003FCD3DA5